MPYSFKIIWREPRRYLPAVMAVAFSDLLITVQVGLLLGALSVLSLPIDHSDAEVWVASPEVLEHRAGLSRSPSRGGPGWRACPRSWTPSRTSMGSATGASRGGLRGLLRDRIAAGAGCTGRRQRLDAPDAHAADRAGRRRRR